VRSTRLGWRITGLTLLIGCCFTIEASAEDVAKKFRIGLGVGFMNAQDEVPSDAANTLNLLDSLQSPVDFYRDPRNDSGAFGALEIKSGGLATLYGQYAFTKTFLVELAAGYQKSDVGDVQVQAQFLGLDIPDVVRFQFQVYNVPVGQVEQIPLQLTYMGRFRPKSSLNPYLGAGFGYTFLGFTPSDEFNQLSVAMDASQGQHYTVSSAYYGDETLVSTPDPVHDLAGASVEFSGTWESHLVGGVEISFKRKWVVFVDARYSFSTRSAKVGFDGTESLGTSVPLLTDYCADPPGAPPPGGTRQTVCPGSVAGERALNGVYGPMRIDHGGLIDGGRIAPKATAPAGTDCTDPLDAGDCEFVLQPDGVVDPGYYYAQGGSFKYDAFALQVGIRFTF
jgi:outer membrane protein W